MQRRVDGDAKGSQPGATAPASPKFRSAGREGRPAGGRMDDHAGQDRQAGTSSDR